MLYLYFLVALRNIRRRPLYAALNLGGLTLGIGATLFILLYIHFELSFDLFHARADRVYRIDTHAIETRDNVIDVAWTQVPGNLGPLITQDYPEVQSYVRCYPFFQEEAVKLQYGDRKIEESQVFAVDSSVFSVFTFDLLQGNPADALRGPNKIVLSESLARRLFGDENALGKIITSHSVFGSNRIDSALSFSVTGIYRDMPPNAHWIAQAMLSAESDPDLDLAYFNRFSYPTYILLQADANATVLASRFSEVYDKYLDKEREPVMRRAEHMLVPLREIHMRETGGMGYLYIFGAVGLLLLLIAGISYVNLTTAQASKRALEVGLRKVLGSHRRQLVSQYLSESMLFTFLAAGLGVVLLFCSVAPVNQMLGLQLDASQLAQPRLIGGLLAIVFFLGMGGGSYPAFFLSAFSPLTALKGQFTTNGNRHPLRKFLVGLQVAVVIFVLICTGMIYEQLSFIRSKDLGFDRDQVVQLDLIGNDGVAHASAFREKLLQSPHIVAAGTAQFTTGQGLGRRPLSALGKAGPEPQFVRWGVIDYYYLETLGIELLEGRNFSEEYTTDGVQGIIVNETLVRNFGLQPPIIGQKVRFGDQGNPNFRQIIGVVKDFHQQPLHRAIESQMYLLEPVSHLLSVKVAGDLKEGMHHIEKSWAEVFPQVPLEYHFLDELLERAYTSDQIRGKIFLSFSSLTLLIAFLGLFGLASYLASQRVREIGIRRVVGAGMRDIVLLLTRDFLLIVGIAALPATVAAWWMVRHWLENFAYRTGIDYLLFAGVILFTLLLTFVITGLHALRAARMNPADTLRAE